MTQVFRSIGRLRQLRDALLPLVTVRGQQAQQTTNDQQEAAALHAQIGDLAQSLGLPRLASEAAIAAALQAAGLGSAPVARPAAQIQPAIVAQRIAVPTAAPQARVRAPDAVVDAEIRRITAEVQAANIVALMQKTALGRRTLAQREMQ